MANRMVEVESLLAVPKGHGYMIIIFGIHKVHIPGDERSRTHPGHGYPARTEEIPTRKILVTEDVQAFKETLTDLYKEDPARNDILALEVKGQVGIRIEAKVDIDL